ncbi:hypothetical protein ACRRTK_008467 [Alexandromys fortis]
MHFLFLSFFFPFGIVEVILSMHFQSHKTIGSGKETPYVSEGAWLAAGNTALVAILACGHDLHESLAG